MTPTTQNDQTRKPEAAKGWQTPQLKVLYIAGVTKNTPLCGTVDSPCTKQSSFGPEDCGIC